MNSSGKTESKHVTGQHAQDDQAHAAAILDRLNSAEGNTDTAEGILAIIKADTGPDVTSIANSAHMLVEKIQEERATLEKTVEARTTELKYLNQRLKSELHERRAAEGALRESNVKLSDALRDLQVMQRELIQQERISALGQMAGGIAHDFNNALMPIVGLSELLLANPSMLENQQELRSTLEDIRSAATDARDVVHRLKEFYRTDDELSLAPVDLNEIVKKSISLTRTKWQDEMQAQGTPVTVVQDLGDISLISGQASQLRELMINIILNAIDAMSQGGTLTFRSRSGGRWVIVEVTDTGEGMTAKVKSRCFEPFFSTKGGYGSGMGLAMAFGIMRRHRGNIEIHTSPGEGTTIEMRFPLVIAAAEEHDVPSPKVVSSPGALRILVVEDDIRSSRLLERYLEAEGHTVITEDRGKEGVRRYRTDNFDLVITDRAIPDISGDQVAQQIRDADPNMPIIMLTGFGELMKETGEIPESIDKLLSKPVTPSELRDAISEVIETHNAQAEQTNQ